MQVRTSPWRIRQPFSGAKDRCRDEESRSNSVHVRRARLISAAPTARRQRRPTSSSVRISRSDRRVSPRDTKSQSNSRGLGEQTACAFRFHHALDADSIAAVRCETLCSSRAYDLTERMSRIRKSGLTSLSVQRNAAACPRSTNDPRRRCKGCLNDKDSPKRSLSTVRFGVSGVRAFSRLRHFTVGVRFVNHAIIAREEHVKCSSRFLWINPSASMNARRFPSSRRAIAATHRSLSDCRARPSRADASL